MSPPRNRVLDALAKRLDEELRGNGIVTVTRRMYAGSPAPEQMPALVVGGVTEQTNEEDTAALPGKWTIRVGCFLWAKTERPEGPSVLLMELIDRIENALKARPGETGGWWTTLDGLVWHAGLVGVDTLVDEATASTGLAILRIEVACKPVR